MLFKKIPLEACRERACTEQPLLSRTHHDTARHCCFGHSGRAIHTGLTRSAGGPLRSVQHGTRTSQDNCLQHARATEPVLHTSQHAKHAPLCPQHTGLPGQCSECGWRRAKGWGHPRMTASASLASMDACSVCTGYSSLSASGAPGAPAKSGAIDLKMQDSDAHAMARCKHHPAWHAWSALQACPSSPLI